MEKMDFHQLMVVSFSCLDDLISYMYAFYDSMRIDMSLQFDFLPVTVRKYDQKQDNKGQKPETNRLKFSESIAERTTDSIADTLPKLSKSTEDKLQLPSTCFAESFAELFAKEAKYFAECFAIEADCFAKRSANDSLNLHKDFDDAFPNVACGCSRIEVADNDMLKHLSIGKKRKKRTEYNEMYKKKQRQDPAFKASECAAKQKERQDPNFKANEIIYQRESMQNEKQDPAFKADEHASMQNDRQHPAFKANKRASKQKERQDPAFKANERACI